MRTITSVKRSTASATVTSGRQSTSLRTGRILRSNARPRQPRRGLETISRTSKSVGRIRPSIHPTRPLRTVYSSRTLTQQCSQFSRQLGATSNPVKRHCTSPRMARCVGSSITAFVSQTGALRGTGLSSGRSRITRSRKFGCKGRGDHREDRWVAHAGYRLPDRRRWSATLSLEAEIHVRLKKTIRTDVVNGTNVDVVYREETRNVSDSIDVEVYDLSAYPITPNIRTRIPALPSSSPVPGRGYTLTEDGDARVRGVWRFYTARDTNWDALVRSNRTASTEVESDAIPVFVHAYPSRIGPRAEPVRDGPEIVDTWGLTDPLRWEPSARTSTSRS